MFHRTLLISAISMAILSGCSDGNGVTVIDDEDQNSGTTGGETDGGETTTGDTGGSTDNPDPVGEVRSLQKLDNNDAFFDALRNGLARQNESNIVPQLGVVDEIAISVDAADGDVAFAESAPSSSGTDGGSTDDSSASREFTTTNVQEIGVDEQDRVKSDGDYLYIIDNDYNFDGEPDIGLTVEPFDLAADSYVPETITSKVRILQLQPDAPDAQLINEVVVGLNGAAAEGMYLHKSGGNTNLVLTATSFGNFLSSWYDPYAFSNATSVVGKVDVSDPTQAAVSKTLRIDGQIVSSRRIDDNLFIASRYYPTIPGLDPWSMSPEEYTQALENADLWASLPKIHHDDNSQPTELVSPSECFVSTRAEDNTDPYYSPDIVTLAVIDINTMQLKDSECFLGSTETLYATPNSVYLATTQWDYEVQPFLALDDTASTTGFVDSRINTDIHQFSINGSELSYSGSGVVAGHLGWNSNRMPFRMSEKGDYLRVATFAENQDGQSSPINVSVLDVSGDGALTTAAVLPNANRPEHIGKPGEQLYASRFLGDKGYLVTFRQTDPLYVVDFSNPNDPKLEGELEIEGYSDYLHPIDENYLLGIGRDAVEPNDGSGGAVVQGVKLALFNVSDSSNPFEVQSMIIGERGTYADALHNHRAITVQRATDEHPTRVAFGITVHGENSPNQNNDPWNYYNWNYTGLHGFDITTGDNAGIEQRGSMRVQTASNPQNGDWWAAGEDRSVIVDDATYYIFGASVYSANWNDLGNFVGPR